MAKKAIRRLAVDEDPRFGRVVAAFAADRRVHRSGKKGFGAGALRVNGKIFAMMTARGEFVVKLPESRVNGLVSAGRGSRFDPRGGRPMQEWLVADLEPEKWIEPAREACEFAKNPK